MIEQWIEQWLMSHVPTVDCTNNGDQQILHSRDNERIDPVLNSHVPMRH